MQEDRKWQSYGFTVAVGLKMTCILDGPAFCA
jgi:hypothetical protein